MEMIIVLLMMWGFPLLGYLAFALPALFYLRRREMDDTSRAVWTLAIIAIPIMGAVAFVIMQPGQQRSVR
jgi:hypothetical protein